MAEATVLVCDICGRPAVETVTIKVGRRNLQKDFCRTHLDELVQGARTPRPGRRKAVIAAQPAKRRGRPPKATSGNGRRRGRPRKRSSGKAA